MTDPATGPPQPDDIGELRDEREVPRAEPVEAPPALAAVFLPAAGIGLVAGWAELGMVLAQRAIDPHISMASLRTNRHFAWMIPVSDLLLFVAVGLLLVLLARFQRRLASWFAWRLPAGLAALTLLLTIEGLYPIAGVVLACGVGLRVGPMLGRLSPGLGPIARVGLPALAAALVVLTGLTYARVVTAERRALAQLPPSLPRVPNVLLIVLDNVRAESMSLYGHDRPTTPNLDRLARRGVVFTHARSTAPWTLPSHASLFTGQWCHKLSVGYDRPLDDAFPTLAETLAAQGYATAGFVGNTYYCNTRYGLDRGFARYEDYYENQAVTPFEVVRSTGLGRRILQALGCTIRVEDGRSSIRKTAEMLHRDVLRWIDGRPRDQPFFVFLNDFDAHSPFVPPPGPDPRFGRSALPEPERIAILKKYQRLMTGTLAPGDGDPSRIDREATEIFRDSYESCVAYLDRQVGRLFDELDRRGLRENTLVIVTSDHGEHFKEHGFLGHGLSLYRREVHVPLLIFPPYSRSAGRVVAEPVSLRELPATVIDLLGLVDRSPFPGRSLARFWGPTTPDSRPTPSPLLAEVGAQKRFLPGSGLPVALGPVHSLMTGGKMYIRNGRGDEEVYDVEGDPLETNNLINRADLHPSAEHLRGMLELLLGDSGRVSTARRDLPRESK